MHRLVVDVVLHEEVVHAGQEGHLRQGEDVHELLHGVAVGALQDGADHIRLFAFQPRFYKLGRRRSFSPCRRSRS